VRRLACKSVAAAGDIAEGAPLTTAMVMVKRPGTGIPAWDYDAVIGKTARMFIPGDTILSWDMLR